MHIQVWELSTDYARHDMALHSPRWQAICVALLLLLAMADLGDATCVTGGCNGELCHKEGDGIGTICLYKKWYRCLRRATCVEKDGQCTWESKRRNSEGLERCLGKKSGGKITLDVLRNKYSFS